MSNSKKGGSDYDLMKDLMNKMREHQKSNKSSNLIREDDSSKTLTDDELKREEDEFKKAVEINTEFKEFKIYKDSIDWSGILLQNQIQWVFSLDSQDGVYITNNNLQLTEATIENIQKLKAYYDVWSEKWSKEIRNMI